MTESDPVTAVDVLPEALADARAIVAAHLTAIRNGGWVDDALLDQLTESIALAIQSHMNAAELAELERQQAVHAAADLRQRVREAADRTHVDTWITCPRCSARAPTVLELRHEVACRLSSAPPPRKSDVAPRSGREE